MGLDREREQVDVACGQEGPCGELCCAGGVRSPDRQVPWSPECGLRWPKEGRACVLVVVLELACRFFHVPGLSPHRRTNEDGNSQLSWANVKSQ